MSDKKQKLLPCPFCGGQAEIQQKTRIISYNKELNMFVAVCIECGCSSAPYAEYDLYHRNDSKKIREKIKQRVIKLWNTRKPMEHIKEQLEKEIEENAGASEIEYRAGMYKAIEIVKKGGVNE